MRNHRSVQRAAALLRRGMALSAAVALVCSLALSAGAVEVDVLNEATGLVESVDLDDTPPQSEEITRLDDDFLLDDAFSQDEEPADEDDEPDDVQEPADEDEEAPSASDDAGTTTPSAPKADADTIQQPTLPSDDKAGDTVDAPDDDFLFVDAEEEQDEDTTLDDSAFSVSVYAEPNNSVTMAYYYDGKFYTDAKHENAITFSEDETVTMETFIRQYCQSGATIYMDSIYTVSDREEWSDTVTIDGGKNLTLSKIDTAIHVTGTLTLGRGVTIQNFSGTDEGAVYVDGGTLNIDGATLKDNTAVNQAGCIRVEKGTLTLYDGTVSGNTTTGTTDYTSGNGGGIYLNNESTFNMYGGKVSNNTRYNKDYTNEQNGGGGVYVQNSTFNLYDGLISGNKSYQFGAGVCVVGTSGTFSMYGGTIEENTIGDSGELGFGAGVRVERGATFNMHGGIITKNKSQHSSALSVLEQSHFNMYGGTIVGNTNYSQNDEANEVSIAGTMNISGGTVGGINIKNNGNGIKDGKGIEVVQKNIKIGTAAGILVTRSDVTIKNKNGDVVSSADYGFDDTYTDEKGCIYLWLPESYTAESMYSTSQTNYKAVIQRDNYGTYENVGDDVSVQTKLYAQLEIDPTTTDTQDYSIQMYSADAEEASTAQTSAQFTYQWQVSDSQVSDSKDGAFKDIPCTASSYTPDDDMANRYVRVIITKDNKPYTSEAVHVLPRQLSFQVPASLTVVVSPDGTCAVSAEGTNEFSGSDGSATYATLTAADATGTITNNSESPICLTKVTFTWDSEAKKYFTNFNTTKPEINLTVGTESAAKSTTGNSDAISWTLYNATVPAKTGGRVPGELDLAWSFSLNGNAISQELQADTKQTIGTITYTVSFADTSGSADTSSAADTWGPGTSVMVW